MVKKKFMKNHFWDILQGFTAAILWGCSGCRNGCYAKTRARILLRTQGKANRMWVVVKVNSAKINCV